MIAAEYAAAEAQIRTIRQCEGEDYIVRDLAIRLQADEETLFKGPLKEYRQTGNWLASIREGERASLDDARSTSTQ